MKWDYYQRVWACQDVKLTNLLLGWVYVRKRSWRRDFSSQTVCLPSVRFTSFILHVGWCWLHSRKALAVSKAASQKGRFQAQVVPDSQLRVAAAINQVALLPSPSRPSPPNPSWSWILWILQLSPRPLPPAPRWVLESGPPFADLPAPWSPW